MTIKPVELKLKKQTLTAWVKILFQEGKINLNKCNKMLSKIDKLTS